MSVIDGFGKPIEWDPSIMVSIFKGKIDFRNCTCHRSVKLLEHGMKVVESVSEKRLCRIVIID